MLIELGTDRLYGFNKGVNHTLRASLAVSLSFIGANTFNPEQVSAQPLIQSTTTISRSVNPGADINIDSLTASVSNEVSYLTTKLTELGLDDPTGRIITKAKVDPEGRLRVTYEKLDLVRDDIFRPSNRLRLLSERGYDLYMDYGRAQGASRIPLPKEPIEPMDIPSYISDILSGMGSIFGRDYYPTGIGEYGLYKTYRIADEGGDTFAIQEMIDGPDTGKLTLATIAPYFFDAGLIPQDLVLTEDQLGIGGGTPVPTPKPEPQPTPTTIIFPRYPQIPLPEINQRFNRMPLLEGDAACTNQARRSLELLQKAPTEFNMVGRFTGVVTCTDKSIGFVYNLQTPTRVFIPRSEIGYDIAFVGAIVHETCHVWQDDRFMEQYPGVITPAGISSGKDAEQECYNIQYQTQKKLGDHPENLKLFREFVYQRFGIIIYNP